MYTGIIIILTTHSISQNQEWVARQEIIGDLPAQVIIPRFERNAHYESFFLY